jgi:hypothetical protein
VTLPWCWSHGLNDILHYGYNGYTLWFQIDSLQGTIQQLEIERNQLMDSLKTQRDMSDNLSVKVSDLQEEIVQNSKGFSLIYWMMIPK